MNMLSWIFDASFSTRLTLALLHFIWQGCAGGVVVIVAGWLLRTAAARTRYSLNVAAMLMMAACLPVTFVLSGSPDSVAEQSAPVSVVHEIPVHPSSHDEFRDTRMEHRLAVGPEVVSSSETLVEPDPATEAGVRDAAVGSARVSSAGWFPSLTSALPANAFSTLSRWIAALYLTGVTLILGRLLRGVWGGHRLRKLARVVANPVLLELVRNQAHRLRLKVTPAVAWCDQISIPVVVGIVAPMILLPMAVVSGLTSSQLQALLLHELAHIRRFDPIVNLLQRIIEAVLFFHPVVWFVSRRISIEREHAADDMVVAAGWDRSLYADALVRVAELASSISCPDIARRATILGATGANPSEFKLRVLRLLGDTRPHKLDLSRAAVLVTFLFVVMGGMFTWSQTDKLETPEVRLESQNTSVTQTNVEPAQVAAERPIPKQLEPFDGTWAVELLETESATLKIEYPQQSWRWTIKGNEVVWGREGQQWKLAMKRDPSTAPKQIDFTFLDGPHKGEVCLGIYEWIGNSGKKLRIRMQDPGAKVGRPTDFELKAGSQTSLIALRSIAPIDPVKELASFQGTWCFDTLQFRIWPEPIGIGIDGNGRQSEQRMVVKGNQISWTDRQGTPITAEFTIDPFKTPKQIDFTFLSGPNRGAKSLGIYEPQMGNDDYLWLCMTNPGTNAPRPIDVSYSGLKQQSMIGMYQVAPPEKPSNAKALERFQGVWTMALCDSTLQTFGARQQEMSNWQWTLEGDEILWRRGGDEWKLKLEVDPSKRPKEINLTYLTGPYKGNACQGMYEWGGVDELNLMIAIQDPGSNAPRPKRFSMNSSVKTGLMILQPRKPNAPERQIGQFQGTWTLRNFDTGRNNDKSSWPLPSGKRPDASGKGSELRWMVKGNEITWTSPAGQEIKAAFTTNPELRPKQIDLTFLSGPNRGETCPGIYHRGDLDENILWLCMADPGKNTARPKNFSYQFGEGRSVLSLYLFESSTVAPADASLKP
ncbi:MAG: blaR1 2 [Planctomycetaceae bacterium]|nr:blaR1 2 [Planctomycetaceae bacterium]